jgi:hypothetical protein
MDIASKSLRFAESCSMRLLRQRSRAVVMMIPLRLKTSDPRARVAAAV